MFDKIFKKSKSKNYAFQEGKQAFSNNIPNYLNLDKHFHRLIEIEEALGEIGALLENVSIKPNVCESIGDMHIAGFLAYYLAQEGLSLLHILSVNYAIAKKDKSYKHTDQLDSIVDHMRKVEPILLKTLHDMEPFKSSNAEEMVKAVLSKNKTLGSS